MDSKFHTLVMGTCSNIAYHIKDWKCNVKMGNAEIGGMEWPFSATVAYSLLKLCIDPDLAFVNASLDLAARESLQTPTSEYQQSTIVNLKRCIQLVI